MLATTFDKIITNKYVNENSEEGTLIELLFNGGTKLILAFDGTTAFVFHREEDNTYTTIIESTSGTDFHSKMGEVLEQYKLTRV